MGIISVNHSPVARIHPRMQIVQRPRFHGSAACAGPVLRAVSGPKFHRGVFATESPSAPMCPSLYVPVLCALLGPNSTGSGGSSGLGGSGGTRQCFCFIFPNWKLFGERSAQVSPKETSFSNVSVFFEFDFVPY